MSAKFPSASSPGELQKAATPKPVSVQPQSPSFPRSDLSPLLLIIIQAPPGPFLRRIHDYKVERCTSSLLFSQITPSGNPALGMLSKSVSGSQPVYPGPTVSSLGNAILHVSLEISPSKKQWRASPELASTYLLRPLTFLGEPTTMPLLGRAKGLVYKSPNTK